MHEGHSVQVIFIFYPVQQRVYTMIVLDSEYLLTFLKRNHSKTQTIINHTMNQKKTSQKQFVRLSVFHCWSNIMPAYHTHKSVFYPLTLLSSENYPTIVSFTSSLCSNKQIMISSHHKAVIYPSQPYPFTSTNLQLFIFWHNSPQ